MGHRITSIMALLGAALSTASPTGGLGAQPRPNTRRRHDRAPPEAAAPPTRAEPTVPPDPRCAPFSEELRAHCEATLAAMGAVVESLSRGTPDGNSLARSLCTDVDANIDLFERNLRARGARTVEGVDVNGRAHASASGGVGRLAHHEPARVMPEAFENARAVCRLARALPGRCAEAPAVSDVLGNSLYSGVGGLTRFQDAFDRARRAEPCVPDPASPVAAPPPAARQALEFSFGGGGSLRSFVRDAVIPPGVALRLGASFTRGRLVLRAGVVGESSWADVTYGGAPSAQSLYALSGRASLGLRLLATRAFELDVSAEIGGGYVLRSLTPGNVPLATPLRQDSWLALGGATVRGAFLMTARARLFIEVAAGWRMFDLDREPTHDAVVFGSGGYTYAF